MSETHIVNKKPISTKLEDDSGNSVTIDGGKLKVKLDDTVTVSGSTNSTIQNSALTTHGRTVYTSSVITAIKSSTDLNDWVNANNDNALQKRYYDNYNSNAQDHENTYATFEDTPADGKCLRIIKKFNSSSPYNVTSTTVVLGVWSSVMELDLKPLPDLSLTSLNTPTHGDAASTNVYRINLGSATAGNTHTITLEESTGATSSLQYYQLNNVTTSTVVSAISDNKLTISASTGDEIWIETDSDFSGADFSAGFTHPSSGNFIVTATEGLWNKQSTATYTLTQTSAYQNNKFLNLVSSGTDPDFKNKYLSAPLDQQSNTRDIFHEKMGASLPFTINSWWKSSNEPSTLLTYPFSRCLSVPDSTTTGDYIQATNTNADHANALLSAGSTTMPTKSWTCSVWYKAPSAAAPTGDTTRFMFALNDDHGVALETGGDLKLLSPWRNTTMTMPTGKNLWDGEWHLITWTFSHDSSGTLTSPTQYAHNYTWTGSNSGDFLYIDGVQFGGGWNHSRLPPHYTSEDFILAGCESHSSYESLPGKYAHWALESGAQSPDDALARYNSGTPLDLSSTVEYYLNFEDDSTGSISSSTNLTEKGTGYNDSGTPGSDYPTAVNGTSFSIAALSDTNMKGTPAYVDEYLPVLFNNGAKKTVPAVSGFSNTKQFVAGHTNNSIRFTDNVFQNDPSSSTEIINSSRDYTICGWVHKSSSLGNTFLASVGTNGQDNFIIYWLDIYDKLHIETKDTGTSWNNHYYGSGSDLGDGDWHFIAITYKGDGISADDTVYADRGADTTSNLYGFTVYRDGQRVAYSSGVSSWNHGTGSGQRDPLSGADTKFSFGGFPSLPWGMDTGERDNYSVHNVEKTASEIEAMWNSGVPTDLSSDSSCKVWIRAEDQTASSFSDSDAIVNSKDNSTYPATSEGNSNTALTVTSLASTESTYVTASSPTPEYDTFGNGLTLSFSKKVNTSSNTIGSAADQSVVLLVDLNGFEGSGEWAAYNVPLDGSWKNLQVVWNGGGVGSKTWDSDLCFYLNGSKIYKQASKDGASTFTSSDSCFKYDSSDSTQTFIPGNFGASGWKETGDENYIYSMMVNLDELSFHSEAVTSAMASDIYNSGSGHQLTSGAGISNPVTEDKIEGYWRFEETASTTKAEDTSTKDVDLNLNGSFVTGDWESY